MAKKIKYATRIKGFPLIKIKSRALIERLRAGSFWMNSLKVYREMYENSKDEVIGDPHEGKFFVHDAIIQISGLGINEAVKDYPFPTANENDFVFCMFGVNPKKHHSFAFTEEQKQKLIGFDDTTLLITDVYEFCRRVTNSAIARGYEITSGFVNYYDETVDDVERLLSLVTNGMQNIVFHKRERYSYQQEFRFTIQNTTGDRHLELDIGDISDISEILTTKDIFSSYAQALEGQ